MNPLVVALAHLWLPGFLLSVCLGACYQLMPVVLGAALRVAQGAAVVGVPGISAVEVRIAWDPPVDARDDQRERSGTARLALIGPRNPAAVVGRT